MISHDLKRIETMLTMVIESGNPPPVAVLKAMLNIIMASRLDVEQLEAKAVPRRQRLLPEHLAGNVALFPLIPRNEAVQP